jgi:replicative DNA helicase
MTTHASSTSEHRRTSAATVADVLAQADRRLRDTSLVDLRPTATGFDILDSVLGGGLRAGELLLLGGSPGVGKTIAALQWARNVADRGGRAVFVCYEHEPLTLLVRLLALETGELGGDDQVTRSVAAALTDGEAQGRSVAEVLGELRGGHDALERLRSYADRLVLVRASGAHTTLDELHTLVRDHHRDGQSTAVFVDYLQKIPVHPEPELESEKVTRTVEGLKDLALEHGVPVVLLSAVDAEGMRSPRLRLYHLRGSSAIAFESDVVVMLNDKEKAVSKVHLTYDPVRARSFRDWTVMSVEKNRGGPNLVDLEFRKDFEHFRFDPAGGLVSEKLVSERLDEAEL